MLRPYGTISRTCRRRRGMQQQATWPRHQKAAHAASAAATTAAEVRMTHPATVGVAPSKNRPAPFASAGEEIRLAAMRFR